MLRIPLVALLVVVAVPAQSTPDAPEPSRAAMAGSVAKQRDAALRQVTSVAAKTAAADAFFTVPWIEARGGLATAACDALPAAELEKLVQQSARAQGLQPELIGALIQQESGGRPCAVSYKGAQGLMQLMPATSAKFNVADPFDPRQNVEAGARLLKQLLDKYKGDIKMALSAYNAGEARVDRDLGVPPIPETTQYVNAIVNRLPAK